MSAPFALSELLSRVPHSSVIGPMDVSVTGITCDSREVQRGDLFAALKGFERDGRSYAAEAFSRGAAAVISHAEPLAPLPPGTAWVVSPHDREAFSAAAAAIYDTEACAVKLVGVTGTNGKTTVTYLLRSIFRCAGGAGMLGTIEYDDGLGLRPAGRTTPEPHEIHRWLRTLQDSAVPYAAMEVSSHSLAMARVRDLSFQAAAFTNLTRDHLDFHKTMEAYYLAKKSIFDLLAKDGAAVLNIEDSYGVRLAGELGRRKVITVGYGKPADVRPKSYTMDLSGIRGIFTTPFGPL